MKKIILLFLISFYIPLFAYNKEEQFNLIQSFFKNNFPENFVATIKSPSIDLDIKKIPKIYIHDSSKKPELIIYFSQKYGVKVFMDNVAKGIGKQYNRISESFKFLFPFFSGNTFTSFSETLDIKQDTKKKNIIYLSENNSIHSNYYKIELGAFNQITSITQIEENKTTGKIIFFYKKNKNLYLITKVKVSEFRKSSNRYSFAISHYDLSPNLKQEDFLG